MKINNLTFQDSKSTINYPTNLVQEYPYQYLTFNNGKSKTKKKSILLPVVRGFNKEKGNLNFKVNFNKKLELPTSDKFFTMIKEFKTNSKNLILKDYIDVYDGRKRIKYEYDL